MLDAVSDAWAVAADDLWVRVGGPPGTGDVTRTGASTGLASPLPVDALAMGAVSVAGRAAAVLRGVDPAGVTVDGPRVGSAFRADQLLRLGGVTPGGFAPLSGFFRAADGWVRTHANYPHHRARLVAVLGTEDVPAAIAARPAREVEEAVTAAGGIAVAVRTRAGWSEEEQGKAVAVEPLAGVGHTGVPGAPAPERPRVLDLTRVLAGPVATRTLALVGCDVLRVDPPGLDEIAAQHVDTGIGKRTSVLDARSAEFAALLEGADVVVTGYRPGAVEGLGLDPATLHARRPDLVVVRLDAWGWTGPWAGRRGFDSIVQAGCGIADLCGTDGDRPGALPAQALDHATGYLAAASALLGLAERAERGGSVRELALARTAEWLFTTPTAGEVAPVEPVRQPLGDAELPPPALVLPGGPDRWTTSAHPLGSDAPEWP
jgi:crotonobetainyl-CoA:carnitine CoA-transferase CaiB-like acyl-CoA transferase